MLDVPPQFEVRLASDAADRRAAERLRYRVFVGELGGSGPLVDHRAGCERDRFDDHARHLILIDHARPAADAVVGSYRLIDAQGAAAAGGFYSEGEYDLRPLKQSGRRLMELGRSCVDPAYRGGAAMTHLWQALAGIILAEGIEVLFGVASFPGTDPAALAGPLSLLHHDHLAPPDLRPVSRQAQAAGGLIPAETLDRTAAALALPALIKAYLRLGGRVGAGAFVDRDFQVTDVCLVLDIARLSAQGRALYARPRG
jgi:putative hemolysin